MKHFPRHSFVKLTLLLFAALTFFACQKEIDGGSGIITPPVVDPNTNLDLTTKVNAASISGFVTDESNAPVVGATVLIGSSTVATDKYGYFETKNVSVVKNAAVITVSKPGYFKGIKTYIAQADKSAFFRVKLLAKTPTPSGFSAAAGGTVTSADGIKIVFPANGIVTSAGGTAYTGNVTVAARFIDPTSSELNKIMPGDLRGIDDNNSVKKLATYGMAAVELTGASGELLQIAPGKKATISFPLPASISGIAPASIPLWHFDETIGLWKQEGSAAKTGNVYVGDVSHFSFWNCDVPANYVELSCTLKTSSGLPVPFALVKITKIGEVQNTAAGLTDLNGFVTGAVPANSALKLEVFAGNSCGTPIYTQTINTTQEPISLGVISIELPAGNTANITGNITDCNDAPVTDGYVMVGFGDGGLFRYPVTNTGTYTFYHVLCNGPQTATIVAEDIAGAQQNPTPVSFIVNPGNNTVPLIKACGLNIEQFINYSAHGVTKSLTYPADSLTARINQGFISINCNQLVNPNDNFIGFMFPANGIAVGSTASVTNLQATVIPPMTYTLSAPIMVNITEYGGQGGFISGNYTTTLNERDPNLPPGSPPGAPFTFTCSFRIRIY